MKQKVRRWNRVMGTVLIMVLIMVLFLAGVWWLKKPSYGVFNMKNYTITQDHLAIYEKECRAEVTSHFYNQYHLDPNEEGFWETEIHGENPKEILKEKAVDLLAFHTAERMKASEYGIPVDITLREIKKSLEEENRKRQSLSVSHGPGQYGLMEYISRTQMETRDRLKEKLIGRTLNPSEEQLKEVYERADPALFDKGCKARVGIYMFYGGKAGEHPQELKNVWDFVEKGFAAGKEPEDILQGIREWSQVPIEYEEVEYDAAEFPRDNQEMAWLAQQTRSMLPGQTSGVLDYGASQGILKVLEKQDYGRAGYEESKNLLKNLWLEKAYPEYIKQCMEAYGYSAIRAHPARLIF